MAKTKGYYMKSILIIICFLFVLVAIIAPKQTEQAIKTVCSWFSPAKKFDAKNYLAITRNDKLVPVVKEKYGELINSICQQEKVNPALSGTEIEKMIIIESSVNPNAQKNSDGVGLMGVTPRVARIYGVDPDSLRVPYWNLLAGIRHLSYLANRLDGNVPAAIVAYNCGLKNYLNNYQAAGVNPSKARYYQKVKILTEVEKKFASVD